MRARTSSSRFARLLAILVPVLAATRGGERACRRASEGRAVRRREGPLLESRDGRVRRARGVPGWRRGPRCGRERDGRRSSRPRSPSRWSTLRLGTSPGVVSSSRGPRTGAVLALDFRETAPARASRDMFLGPDGRPVPSASTATALAVATPGSVRGYAEAHRRPGAASRGRAVVAPAERLAREGFRVPPGSRRDLAGERVLLTRWEETRRVFFRDGAPLAPGDAPPAARPRRDPRANREGGAGGVPPGSDRGADRGLRPVPRRRPLGGGPRGLRARLAGSRGDPVRPPRRLHDAAPVVGGLRPAVGARAARGRAGRSSPRVSTRAPTTSSSRRSGAPTPTGTAGSATGTAPPVPLGELLAPARLAALGASIDPATRDAAPLPWTPRSRASARRRRTSPWRRPTASPCPSRRR